MGDRVIQVKNDYDNDVFNGDVGHVTAVASGAATIDFSAPSEPGQAVEIKGGEARQRRAGLRCEHPQEPGQRVPGPWWWPCTAAIGSCLQRNLLYTAVTPGEAVLLCRGQSVGDRRRGGGASRVTAVDAVGGAADWGVTSAIPPPQQPSLQRRHQLRL